MSASESLFGGVVLIIKYYDPLTFETKGVITKAKSVVWNKKFYTYGTFDLEIDENVLSVNDIIYHNGNAGIVMQVVRNLRTVKVSGYDLKGITKFRHLFEITDYSGKSEKIVKDIATQFLNTGDRKIDGMSIVPDKGTGNSIAISFEDENLSDVLSKICEQDEIGYTVDFDETNIIFDVVKGIDRTDTVVFSRGRKNVEDLEYTRDNFDYCNVAYYLDENEAIQSEGTATGMLRREGATRDDVITYLAEKKSVETLRGTANDKLIYKKDWNLGDYVTVEFEDMITTKQITEVQEVHEPNRNMVIPVFGSEKENIIKKIMRG